VMDPDELAAGPSAGVSACSSYRGAGPVDLPGRPCDGASGTGPRTPIERPEKGGGSPWEGRPACPAATGSDRAKPRGRRPLRAGTLGLEYEFGASSGTCGLAGRSRVIRPLAPFAVAPNRNWVDRSGGRNRPERSRSRAGPDRFRGPLSRWSIGQAPIDFILARVDHRRAPTATIVFRMSGRRGGAPDSFAREPDRPSASCTRYRECARGALPVTRQGGRETAGESAFPWAIRPEATRSMSCGAFAHEVRAREAGPRLEFEGRSV